MKDRKGEGEAKKTYHIEYNPKSQCCGYGCGWIGTILPDPDPHLSISTKYKQLNYRFIKKISIYRPECYPAVPVRNRGSGSRSVMKTSRIRKTGTKHCCGSMTFCTDKDLVPRTRTTDLRILLFSSLTFKMPTKSYTSIFDDKSHTVKKLQNNRHLDFSYYFCLMMEGSGSVQIMTDRS